MANPVAAEIVLSEDERATLERWARRPKSAGPVRRPSATAP